jgi:hypothetical protein
MSRSRRKTPIFGLTNSRSEKQDKKIWHGRLRAQERTALTTDPAKAGEKVLPEVRDASNPWSMDKDGRCWWSLDRQAQHAERAANRQGRTRKEREALKARLQHRWMAK